MKKKTKYERWDMWPVNNSQMWQLRIICLISLSTVTLIPVHYNVSFCYKWHSEKIVFWSPVCIWKAASRPCPHFPILHSAEKQRFLYEALVLSLSRTKPKANLTPEFHDLQREKKTSSVSEVITERKYTEWSTFCCLEN